MDFFRKAKERLAFLFINVCYTLSRVSIIIYATYLKWGFKGLDARERDAPPEYLYKGFCLFYSLARSNR